MPDYYVRTVIDQNDSETINERLVRAKNRAAALAHVVADTIKVEVATTEDAMRIAKQGGEVEIAAEVA